MSLELHNGPFQFCLQNFPLPFFFGEYLNPHVRINKLINEHTVYYHPTPSGLTSRISPHISIDSLGIYLFRIFAEFVLKPVYPTMVGDDFQVYGGKITGKCICESKNWIYSFLLYAPNKTRPQILFTLRQKEITHFFQAVFFENIFSPSTKAMI